VEKIPADVHRIQCALLLNSMTRAANSRHCLSKIILRFTSRATRKFNEFHQLNLSWQVYFLALSKDENCGLAKRHFNIAAGRPPSAVLED
jgi:hypothetical protein